MKVLLNFSMGFIDQFWHQIVHTYWYTLRGIFFGSFFNSNIVTVLQ